MDDSGYRDNIVYAGELREEQPQPAQPIQEQKTEEKRRRTSDWVLVAVAAVGLILTVYYIGFGHLTAPITIWPNATNQTQANNTIVPPVVPPTNVTYGVISNIEYTGGSASFNSRESANLSLRVSCSDLCRGLYVSVYDGSNRMGEFRNTSSWRGAVNVSVPFSVPRHEGDLALGVFADSANISNTIYGSNAENEAIVYINVLESAQEVIYGREFYLEVGEIGNLTDLNATVTLASLVNGEAKVEVEDKTGMTFGSTLDIVNKPNATFFDFLTIELLEVQTGQVKLMAWPDGLLEGASLTAPSSDNISTAVSFQVYLTCTGTCAGTYVGIYALYEPNSSRIGFYNQTSAWAGFKTVNITSSIPYEFVNRTIDIVVLADTRSSERVSYLDWRNQPEKTYTRAYFVHG